MGIFLIIYTKFNLHFDSNKKMMQSGAVFNEDYKIPNNLVGLVIGRGGEQIKKIQSESQCKIRIASESDGTPERSCTLIGSQEQIDMAKQLLADVVSRGQNREQGGEQRGGFGGQRRDMNGGHQQQGGYGGQQGGYNGQQQPGFDGGYQQQQQNGGYRR